MSNTAISLRRKIESAGELQSVVRTMKAVASSSVGQYERSVAALTDYYRTVELGLHACLSSLTSAPLIAEIQPNKGSKTVGVIVFGSDQGLVGQFNDLVADYAIDRMASMPKPIEVWAVGGRVHARLLDSDIAPQKMFVVPTSATSISTLVGKLMSEYEARRQQVALSELHLFYNKPTSTTYEPITKQILPLDQQWKDRLCTLPWPTKTVPEVIGQGTTALEALVREYLFVSIFQACSESLASENSSRLATMQRADKNIDTLLETLNAKFHRLRQGMIDEELFDVVAGFESISGKK
jgi:F-type H+-transporting ATPase subunit gamma